MELHPLTTRTALQEGVECWNSAFPETPFAPRLARQRLLMPAPGVDVELWGGYEGDELQAVVATKRLEEPCAGYDHCVGWVSMLAVDPQVGQVGPPVERLLEHAVDRLQQAGVDHVQFGGALRKFVPGLPSDAPDAYFDALDAVGFEHEGTSSDLYRRLDGGDGADSVEGEPVSSTAATPSGVSIRRARPEDEPALLELVHREFSGRWAYQVESNCRLPGTISDYWVVCTDQELVAFARTGTWDSTVLSSCVNWGARWGPAYCGLGPIGVAEAHRGHGYGLSLIATTMLAFSDAGCRHMTIDGVVANLQPYYAKLGFEPVLTFERFSLSP